LSRRNVGLAVVEGTTMKHTVWLGERHELEAAWLPTSLSVTEIVHQTSRLRGWALMRGAIIAGSAFLTPCAAGGARIYLPLRRGCVPHPESGIRAERLPAGPVAVVGDVPFENLVDYVDVLAALVAPHGCRSAPEYQGRFNGKGQLTFPLIAPPASLPSEVALDAEPGLQAASAP
jgi:hypothetical protein